MNRPHRFPARAPHLQAAGWMLLAVLAMPGAAEAQSFRCVGKDGKKYYGSTVPAQCVGVVVEQLSPQGTVVRRIDPPPSAENRATQDAEAKRKREEEAVAKDDTRRNRALLATYGSEKDIEAARSRALEDNVRTTREVEGRIGALKAGIAELQKKPAPGSAEELRNARLDLKAQEDLLAVKKKDAGVINARYDEDKRRFQELAAMDPAARGRALGVEKGVTVTTKPPSHYDQRRQESEARLRAARDSAELQRMEREREQELRRREYERQREEQQQRYRQQR